MGMTNRIAGIILLVIGVISLGIGGFRYTTRERVVDAGPIQVNADRTHNVPISPILGGVFLVGGALLLASSGRRQRIA